MKCFLSRIPSQLVLPLIVVMGIFVGLGGYTLYTSRAHSYLSDDPATCVNCHVMAPSYQSWSRSSHGTKATCNDCHVPHDNVFSTYYFKAKDGLRHAAVFTMGTESQAPRPTPASSAVIMENCIRCHTALNTNFVKTGMITYADVEAGNGKACWDCHRQVPHTNISGLASAPNALVPLPISQAQTPIVPDWLRNALKQ